MKINKDQEKLNEYLKDYEIEQVFNDRLREHLSLYHFDQGELICSQGDMPEYLYIIVEGKVKIYNSSPEGKILIISYKTALEAIGDIEYVRKTEYLNSVVAESSVWAIGVQHRWLNKYGKSHAPLLQFLLEIITKKFFIKSNSLHFNLLYPVEVRLASYLLSTSYDESNSIYTGKIPTSRLIDIADLIGTSYRHTNRVIRQFCTEGLIERNKEFILIKDKEGLSLRAKH